MRVAFCSPGYSGKFLSFYYSVDKKLINGLTRCGHNVLHFRDRDEADSAFLNIRRIGAPLANRSFRRMLEAYRPELIVLHHADVITPDSLRHAKAELPGCRIVNVDGDFVHSQARYDRLMRLKGIADRTFLTSAGDILARLRQDGLAVDFIPNPTDPSLEDSRAGPSCDKDFDLVYFAGARPASDRWDLVTEIEAACPELRIGRFGAGKSRIFGRAYFDLLASAKCALNWSFRNDVRYYSSDRIAQLFGCGLCVCLPRSSGFDRFIEDDEAVFFDGAADLAQSVKGVIETGGWADIGRRGQAKFRTLFDATRVADYLVLAAFDRPVSGFEWADA